MTDEKIDPLTARVDRINQAVGDLMNNSFFMVKGEIESVDLLQTFQSIGILVGTIVVSLSEIADSVGKIARQSEADFKAAVDTAAEQKAAVIHNEANKRNFIGQPKRNG